MLCLSSEEFNISRQGFNDPQPPCGFTQGILPLQDSLYSKLSLSLQVHLAFLACHICYGEVGWVVLNGLCFVTEADGYILLSVVSGFFTSSFSRSF